MANYSRGPRNDLIRELRAAGWSMRRIAKHPDVDLSPAMVHAVLKADEPTVDDDDEGAAAPRPGARAVVDDRAVLAELMAELYTRDGTVNALTQYQLRHLKAVSTVLTAEDWESAWASAAGIR